MKKYLIASVVAVMAFAFAAFAASLNVTSTAVQAGETQDGIDCVDNAGVTAWSYNPDTGLVDAVTVELSNDDLSAHDCEGATLHVTVLQGTTSLGFGSVALTSDPGYTVSLPGPGVSAEAVDGVRIGIVQQ